MSEIWYETLLSQIWYEKRFYEIWCEILLSQMVNILCVGRCNSWSGCSNRPRLSVSLVGISKLWGSWLGCLIMAQLAHPTHIFVYVCVFVVTLTRFWNWYFFNICKLKFHEHFEDEVCYILKMFFVRGGNLWDLSAHGNIKCYGGQKDNNWSDMP